MTFPTHTLRLTRRRVAGLLCAAMLVGLLPRAQAQAVTLEGQLVMIRLMLKVITYDKAFQGRGQGDFVVVFASEAQERDNRDALMNELQASAQKMVLTRPLKFVRADLD